MPYFSRNKSLSLFYLDEGPRTGAPATVLLMTGLTCDMHDWSWQVPFLLDHGLRVVSVDSRGQGRSSAPQPTTPYGQHGSWPGPERSADPAVVDYFPQSTALDVMALLEHLGVTENLVVMAHSMGDCAGYYLAAVAAADRPGLVRASVGVDPLHAFPNAIREADTVFLADPEAVGGLLVGFFGNNANGMYSDASPAWQKTWHLRRMTGLDTKVVAAQCWGAWGDMEHSLGRRENSVEAFAGKLKCPRLTFGSNDWYVATDRDHMPKGSEELDEVIVIEGMGHWFHQTKSERFNAELGRWLGKIGVLPAATAA